MRVIITGVNGSLGRQLVQHFSGQGHQVLGIGRWPQPHEDVVDLCTYLRKDVNDIEQPLEGDLLIHAAALSDDKGPWKGFHLNNVVATQNLIRQAQRVPNFIFISSSSVYHPSPGLVTESDGGTDSEKLSNYGRSKWMAEEVIREQGSFQSCYILRPRALYGAGDMKIIPRMLRLYDGQQLKVPGKMDIRVSLTSYANLMHALDCCVSDMKPGVHTYNISDQKEYILIDVIRKIIRSGLGYSVPIKHIPIWLVRLIGQLHLKGMSPLLVKALTTDMVLDISQATSQLGYNPKTTLNDHLETIGRWIKSNGGPQSGFFANAN